MTDDELLSAASSALAKLFTLIMVGSADGQQVDDAAKAYVRAQAEYTRSTE